MLRKQARGNMPTLTQSVHTHSQTNLKRGRLETANAEHIRMMDPFVSLLGDSLRSKYDKVWCFCPRIGSFFL